MPPKAKQGQGHGDDRASRDAPAGFRNHGAEVSSAAHDAPRGRGRTHGDAVSEIARGGTGTSHGAGDLPAEGDGEGIGRPR